MRGVMRYARLFRPHPSLRATFPTRGKASFGCADAFESAFEIWWGGIKVSTVRPPSSGADAPPSPSKGKASFGCANLFCSASQFYRNLTFKSALYLTVTNRRSSLPLRGGRWREATDEGGRTALTFFRLAATQTLFLNSTESPQEPSPGWGRWHASAG